MNVSNQNSLTEVRWENPSNLIMFGPCLWARQRSMFDHRHRIDNFTATRAIPTKRVWIPLGPGEVLFVLIFFACSCVEFSLAFSFIWTNLQEQICIQIEAFMEKQRRYIQLEVKYDKDEMACRENWCSPLCERNCIWIQKPLCYRLFGSGSLSKHPVWLTESICVTDCRVGSIVAFSE